ncbi:YdiU family protein [Gulosibacter sp. 10]|uniref:protein adenylyltransferase SelO n=1 Tax=Gulosibacter sp. 10 TaxID=1255570 RepID=UPI00097EF4F1|nr:YdiU family protein [Gulosibacter sp. 10]SJM71799.1 Selenoprotein O and cysteine-containing homologs [Gulosibacter sp. 10]
MHLHSHFATDLPELALPWQADPAPEPQVLVLNESLAEELGLDVEWLRSEEGARFLTGTGLPEDAKPVAQVYSGHQWGVYQPRLGDGRALLLGEVEDARGRLRDIHLKGSGPTPFSRGGDGRAVIGPMLRELIVSEAMAALGVPGTRSLAVTKTGRPVFREQVEQGAVLARVAAGHLRVGSFQYARASGDLDLLKRLADHAIARHHPSAREAEHPYLALFEAIVAAQASLIARWMLVGFVHGVMSTDNMTVSGETIDFGPCAFMDAFDPGAVYSSIDHTGRYAYGRQPVIAQWNLERLAESLLPLLAEDQDEAVALAEAALAHFPERYSADWSAGMREKLGLPPAGEDEEIAALLESLFPLLEASRIDYTSFFRGLARFARDEDDGFAERFDDRAAIRDWLDRWLALRPDPERMDRVNPVYIPRNHLVEEALDAARIGDMAPVGALLEAVSSPFQEREGLERYALPAPADFGAYTTYCGT